MDFTTKLYTALVASVGVTCLLLYRNHKITVNNRNRARRQQEEQISLSVIQQRICMLEKNDIVSEDVVGKLLNQLDVMAVDKVNKVFRRSLIDKLNTL